MAVEEDEEAAFDDVAMSLLLFFLVMTMVSSQAGIHAIRQKTDTIPQKAKKSKKIFGDYDLSVYIGADKSISVMSTGGAKKFSGRVEPVAYVDPENPDDETGLVITETDEGADELIGLFAEYFESLPARATKKKIPKIYLTAHGDATLGVVQVIRYAVNYYNDGVGSSGNPMAPKKLVPCPPLSRPDVVAKVAKFNTCIQSRRSKKSCEAVVKKTKKKLKKAYCSLSQLME